jgi:type II secretory pathway component PulK
MKQRAGFALIGVMIVLVVASMLVVSWLKTVANQREHMRMAEHHLTAEWLAEASIGRAAAKLREKSDYTGETWTISADELGGQDSASIEIHVAQMAGHPDRRTVEVEAEYPPNSLHSVRTSKRIVVNRGDKT